MYNKRMYRVALLTLALLLPLNFSHGESFFGASAGQSPIQIITSPEFPSPNSEMMVTLGRVEGVETNSAEISWYVNDSIIKSGIGEKSITVKTGKVGQKTELGIIVKSPGKASVTETFIFNPAEVDIVWSTKGYAPPFYEGRSLFTARGQFTVEAIPHFIDEAGKKIPAESLVYAWKNNSYNLSKQSGKGRTFATISGSIIKPFEEVEVFVSSADGKLVATNKIRISENEPRIVFYENHPLFGTLFNKAAHNEYTLASQELRLDAVPFHFDTLSRNDSRLEYVWRINSNKVDDVQTRQQIVLRQETDTRGQSQIRLRMNVLGNPFQFDDETLVVKFNQQ
jgi:hypothetical protein